MYKKEIELMRNKKIEILKYIEDQFDVVVKQGIGSDLEPYDVVDRKLMNEYTRHKWEEDRTVWMRIRNNGFGIVIHIKTEVKPWLGGSGNIHYREWDFPIKNEGYSFNIVHGDKLRFSIRESEVELFDISSEYFLNYLKYTFELFQERLKIPLENETNDAETNYQLRGEIARNEESEEESFQRAVEQQISENQNNITKEITYKRKPKQNRSKIVITKYSRDEEVAARALEFARYKCEIDNNHVTFVSRRSGKNYVEAHHLIPICFSDEFDFSLDVEANIVSLCPNCHKKIHHGLDYEVKELIEILYFRRNNHLYQCGLSIGLNRLHLLYLK